MKLDGKLEIQKPKFKCDGHAFQAIAKETHELFINSNLVLFTKEQLDHMYKFFQPIKISLTSSYSLVQKGSFFATAFLGVIPNSTRNLISDFGETNHMTSCSKLF